MGETMKLAVPTMGEAGLESERAGHFGHCDCFTVVEIADGEITGTSEVANPPHEEGECMRPVGLLAKAGVAHGLQPGVHHGVLRKPDADRG